MNLFDYAKEIESTYMESHRGILPLGYSTIIYANDGWFNDPRSRDEAAHVITTLKAKGIEVLGFVVVPVGTWALEVRSTDKTYLEGVVTDAWIKVCGLSPKDKAKDDTVKLAEVSQ